MDSEPTNNPLNQYDFETLEREGRRALNEGDYEQAQRLLREAAARAPLRTDLRLLLSQAVEGTLLQPKKRGASPERRGGSGGAFRRSRPAAAPAGERAAAGGDRSGEIPPDSPRPQAPLARAVASRQRAVGDKGGKRRGPKPKDFQRRHERGPLSAMFFGMLVGIGLVAVIFGIAFLMLQRQTGAGEGAGTRRQVSAILEQARIYEQQGRYSLAIEQLQKLPDAAQRGERLAEIYMEMGDQSINQQPPRLQAAAGNYRLAWEHDPNQPTYGLALAEVYYRLSGTNEGGDAGQATDNLTRARETLEEVLERHPENLEALQLLKRVAIAQQDYTTIQQALMRILEIVPEESEQAEDARNTLRTLGFRL